MTARDGFQNETEIIDVKESKYNVIQSLVLAGYREIEVSNGKTIVDTSIG